MELHFNPVLILQIFPTEEKVPNSDDRASHLAFGVPTRLIVTGFCFAEVLPMDVSADQIETANFNTRLEW